MTPTPPWESGPAPRRYDPDEQYFECANCSAKVTRNESYGCEVTGCTERLGECCRTTCDPCGCTTCSAHLHRTSDGGAACDECIKCEALETLAEAERHEYAIAKRRGDDV